MPLDSATTTASTSRRDFLKLGLISALTASGLGTASTIASASAASPSAAASPGYRFFTPDDIILLRALTPAIMAGSLPTDPVAREQEITALINELDLGIFNIGEANRGEVRKLFDLLTFAPTRVLAAGLWRPWSQATPQRVDQILTGWRDSWIGQFNNAYAALVKIIVLAEFGRPANWTRSGYGGPPAYALQALPQFQTTAKTPGENPA